MKINVTSNECCGVLVKEQPHGSVVKLIGHGSDQFHMVMRPTSGPWKYGMRPASPMESHPNYGAQLVNLETGSKTYVSKFQRCAVYPDASLCPGAPSQS